jgi:hypothetical protein
MLTRTDTTLDPKARIRTDAALDRSVLAASGSRRRACSRLALEPSDYAGKMECGWKALAKLLIAIK